VVVSSHRSAKKPSCMARPGAPFIATCEQEVRREMCAHWLTNLTDY